MRWAAVNGVGSLVRAPAASWRCHNCQPPMPANTSTSSGDDVIAIGLPDFFQAFAANVFLDLAENITHVVFLFGPSPAAEVFDRAMLISPRSRAPAQCARR